MLTEGVGGGGAVMAQGRSGRVGEPVPCLAFRPPGRTVAAVMKGVPQHMDKKEWKVC